MLFTWDIAHFISNHKTITIFHSHISSDPSAWHVYHCNFVNVSFTPWFVYGKDAWAINYVRCNLTQNENAICIKCWLNVSLWWKIKCYDWKPQSVSLRTKKWSRNCDFKTKIPIIAERTMCQRRENGLLSLVTSCSTSHFPAQWAINQLKQCTHNSCVQSQWRALNKWTVLNRTLHAFYNVAWNRSN